MAKQSKTRKINIPICIACVLFYLTLISAYLTSGLYARYTAQGSGGDSARVATFHVTETATQFSDALLIEMSPGVISKDITVINDSEVAINYTFAVTNATNNIPLEFQFIRNDVTTGGTTVSYSMAPDTTETFTMEVVWNQAGADAYVGKVDLLNIALTAEQID